MSFYDVFIFGMNIGSCGLTARHFVKMTGDYDNYRLIYGSADILVGTKKYNENVNFPHVWVETSEWLYDTTMMLKIPLHYAKEALGYETRKIIAKESAKIFSDNEDYYDLSILLNGNKEEIADYFASALKIG